MSNSDRPKPPAPPTDGSKRSGRVSHDARGNPVWEWQTSTGVFSKDVSTQRLKKLQAPDLSLMDTQTVAKQKDPGKEAQATSAKPGAKPKLEMEASGRHAVGGFNPYDNDGQRKTAKRAATTQFDPQRHHPALAHKQQPMRKEAPRQSLQSKHGSSKPQAAPKPQGLLDKIKSVFGSDD